MLLFFHNGRTAKKQCRQDACTALDWVTGLFFQSGRLLGLIMQAIATVIGCCFSKRMRNFFRKNEKSVLQFCNKKPKRKGRLQRVEKSL